MIAFFLVLVFSLALPLLLLPIEKILQSYPYLIEELAKLFLVLMIIQIEKIEKKNYWLFVIFTGLLFALSESIFYLANFFALGNFSLFPQRLVLTSLLHAGTMLIMYFLGRKRRKFLLLGFLITSLLHFAFNFFMARFYTF